MTEKRFTVDRFDLLDDGYPVNVEEACTLLNELYEENFELRQDNDIKFWKHECLRESNTNAIFAFELGKAIEQGYKVSDTFKQMLDKWKKETEEMKVKNERLYGDLE